MVISQEEISFMFPLKRDDGMKDIARTQLLDDLRNPRRHCELEEEAENKKVGNYSLSIEHKK